MDLDTREFIRNHKIKSAKVVSEAELIFTFEDDDKKLTLTACTDCCGYSYFGYCDDLDKLIGDYITDISVGNTKYIEDSCDVHEYKKVRIETDKSQAVVYLHCKHNGYYPGWLDIHLNE